MKKILFLLIASQIIFSCKSSYLNGTLVKKENFIFNKNENERSKLSLSTTERTEIPTSKNDMIWGINGHPLTSPAYKGEASIELQLNLLKEFQSSYYRVNIRTTEDGSVSVYKNDEARWLELLDKAKKLDIKILPVFQLRNNFDEMTATQAYEDGKKRAKGFAERYGDYFDYYELGNEQDKLMVLKDSSGAKITHYNKDRFKVWAAYLKGMSEGVKEADPVSKSIINSAGRTKYGYFQLIKDAGIKYDILGFHWYSKTGTINQPYYDDPGGEDVLDVLYEKFKKPIWITEINQKDGVGKFPEDEQAHWTKNFIKEVQNRPYIKAFFMYELIDQPHLCDGKGWEAITECKYGMVYKKPGQNNYTYREYAKTFKFIVEELKFGKEDIANTLATIPSKTIDNQEIGEGISKNYQEILKRQPTSKELKYWTKKIKKDTSIAEMYESLVNSVALYQKSIIEGYEKRTGFSFYNN